MKISIIGLGRVGSTLAAALIIESIAFDKRHTMPISTLIDGYLGVRDVCLSVPVVVGREGITRVLQPDLNEPEIDAFRASAATVREAINELLRGEYLVFSKH